MTDGGHSPSQGIRKAGEVAIDDKASCPCPPSVQPSQKEPEDLPVCVDIAPPGIFCHVKFTYSGYSYNIYLLCVCFVYIFQMCLTPNVWASIWLILAFDAIQR